MRFKLLAGAAIAAVGLAVAAPAFALQTITVTDAEIPNSTTIGLFDAVSPGINGTFVLGEIYLTDTNDKVYQAFCDAIFQEINLGGGQNLSYSLIPNGVTNDNNGNDLSADTVAHMVWTADQGFASNDPVVQEAAQAAIWQEEYGPGLVETIGNVNVATLAATFEASPDRAFNPNLQIQSLDGHQSFFQTGAVPEPASWALMIVGFGSAGVMLRRRRATMVAV